MHICVHIYIHAHTQRRTYTRTHTYKPRKANSTKSTQTSLGYPNHTHTYTYDEHMHTHIQTWKGKWHKMCSDQFGLSNPQTYTHTCIHTYKAGKAGGTKSTPTSSDYPISSIHVLPMLKIDKSQASSPPKEWSHPVISDKVNIYQAETHTWMHTYRRTYDKDR
jgi:hypothetical protein